mgnify:CR=1 FL=1
MLNRGILIFCVSFWFIFSACEDDPLLAPQSGEEEDGGSYGNLSLPESKENIKPENPETF